MTEIYNVDKIVDHKQYNGVLYYRVRWENYTSESDTWEPEEHILDQIIIQRYRESLKQKSLEVSTKKVKVLQTTKSLKKSKKIIYDDDENDEENRVVAVTKQDTKSKIVYTSSTMFQRDMKGVLSPSKLVQSRQLVSNTSPISRVSPSPHKIVPNSTPLTPNTSNNNSSSNRLKRKIDQIGELPVPVSKILKFDNSGQEVTYMQGETARDATKFQTVYDIYHKTAPVYLIEHKLDSMKLYLIEKCVNNGSLNIYRVTEPVIRQLEQSKDDYTFMGLLSKYCNSNYDKSELVYLQTKSEKKLRITATKIYDGSKLENECVIYNVHVSGTRHTLHSPIVVPLNKLIIQYGKLRLMRVTFDINLRRKDEKYYLQSTRSLLDSTINIAGRVYQFLATSNSGLREQQAYYFAVDSLLPGAVDAVSRSSIAEVYSYFGNFANIKTISKLSSRVGLYFSNSRPTLYVDSVSFIDDITRDNVIFTDGCGKIAPQLLKDILLKDGVPEQIAFTTACIQVRWAGCKGLLVRCPNTMGIEIPASMKKFDIDNPTSEQYTVGLLQYSSYKPAKLNREFIAILEDRKVSFDLLSKILINEIDVTMNDIEVLLKSKSSMVNSIRQFLEAGFDISDVHVKNKLYHCACKRLETMSDLKVQIPNSAFLFGVPDWLDILEEDTVYCNINGRVIEAEVIIGRSPARAPGDMQRVRAVNCYELSYLQNVLVFNVRGKRCLADKLSSGDYDGDRYTVIYDPDIVQSFVNSQAFDYSNEEYEHEENKLVPEDGFDAMLNKTKNFFVGFARMQGVLEELCLFHSNITDQRGFHDEISIEATVRADKALNATKSGAIVAVPSYFKSYSEFTPHHKLPLSLVSQGINLEEYSCRKSTSYIGRLYDILLSYYEKLSAPTNQECVIDEDLIYNKYWDDNQLVESIKQDCYTYNSELAKVMSTKKVNDMETNQMLEKLAEKMKHKYYSKYDRDQLLSIASYFYKYSYERNYMQYQSSGVKKASLASAWLFERELIRLKADSVSNRLKPGSISLSKVQAL